MARHRDVTIQSVERRPCRDIEITIQFKSSDRGEYKHRWVLPDVATFTNAVRVGVGGRRVALASPCRAELSPVGSLYDNPV